MLISNIDVSWNFEAHCTQYKFWKNKIFCRKNKTARHGCGTKPDSLCGLGTLSRPQLRQIVFAVLSGFLLKW